MNRKECYEFIKSHENLRGYFTNKYGNFTNLKTEVLLDEIERYKKANQPVKKAKCDCKATAKCADEGARKAILAIAKILNLKNIERNFN